jgi:hypothetical protein
MKMFNSPLDALDNAKALLHRRRFLVARKPDKYSRTLTIARKGEKYLVFDSLHKSCHIQGAKVVGELSMGDAICLLS